MIILSQFLLVKRLKEETLFALCAIVSLLLPIKSAPPAHDF